MKKKSLLLTLGVLALGTLFMVSGALAGDVPETFTMHSKIYKKAKKIHQSFTHKKHATDYKIACTDCHHEYKDGKNVWKEGQEVKKCEACHTDPKKPKKPKDKELTKEQKIASHYWAIHENCVGCHKELKKAQKPTGPTSCTKCHPKPEKK
jgi:hypothetical protein